jgi:hypothetical protein
MCVFWTLAAGLLPPTIDSRDTPHVDCTRITMATIIVTIAMKTPPLPLPPLPVVSRQFGLSIPEVKLGDQSAPILCEALQVASQNDKDKLACVGVAAGTVAAASAVGAAAVGAVAVCRSAAVAAAAAAAPVAAAVAAATAHPLSAHQPVC